MLGVWILDRILGNAKHDPVAENLKNAKATFEATAKRFAKPANPRPFPRLAPLTDNFVNSSFGKAVLTLKDDALVIEVQATGAKFKLVPWDGDIFMATPYGDGPVWAHSRFGLHDKGICPVSNGQRWKAQFAAAFHRGRSGL